MSAAADYLRPLLGVNPKVAVVLGSGLGAFADYLGNARTISYADIPGWPAHPAAGVYLPVDIEDLMERVAGNTGSSPIFVSLSVPYADRIDEHAHPREVAIAAAVAQFSGFDWSRRISLAPGSSIPF